MTAGARPDAVRTAGPDPWAHLIAEPQPLPAFFDEQRRTWPRLDQAVRALSEVRTRELRVAGREVAVQWNPGRAASTTARVDEDAVRKRPCFLCPENLPPEERGLAFGPDLVILPNPAPILPLHVVVAERAHRPQRLAPVLDRALELARGSGGALTLFYNGPECGASAPDHVHLQGIAAGLLPEERWAAARIAGTGGDPPGLELHCSSGLGVWSSLDPLRAYFVFSGEAPRVAAAVRVAVEAYGGLVRASGEPRVNLLFFPAGDGIAVMLFPRNSHRPSCYFASGEAQCLISPGALDMAGLIVTVRSQDFERIDEELLASVYRETSIESGLRKDLDEALRRRVPRA